ncbi:MAG: hypothetical protein V1907_01435 [Candidatus Kerfeldbacteria bacterium]
MVDQIRICVVDISTLVGKLGTNREGEVRAVFLVKIMITTGRETAFNLIEEYASAHGGSVLRFGEPETHSMKIRFPIGSGDPDAAQLMFKEHGSAIIHIVPMER